jgi:hypothetical protein
MSRYLTNDDEYRDLLYGDDHRSYVMVRSKSPDGCKLGRIPGKRVRIHARSALRRVSGYFGTVIEAIANARVRRMEHELELRGIRFDQTNNNGVARKSRPADRS